jgi:hypothetical protein
VFVSSRFDRDPVLQVPETALRAAPDLKKEGSPWMGGAMRVKEDGKANGVWGAVFFLAKVLSSKALCLSVSCFLPSRAESVGN